jgi:hypothetical protein
MTLNAHSLILAHNYRRIQYLACLALLKKLTKKNKEGQSPLRAGGWEEKHSPIGRESGGKCPAGWVEEKIKAG